jgi:hypothetical protein
MPSPRRRFCAEAASQTDPKLRRDYLIIGACWLKLSSELSEQLVSSKMKRREQQFAPAAELDEGMEILGPLVARRSSSRSGFPYAPLGRQSRDERDI